MPDSISNLAVMKNEKLINTLLAAFLISIGLSSCTQSIKEPERISTLIKIDSLLQAKHDADLFHGSVFIQDPAGNKLTKSYGVAHRGWDIPNDENTVFDIASVNKSMISGLIMIAAQEGKLQTSNRLVDLLEEFEIGYSGKFSEEITLHHMMSHSSGLPDYDAVGEELSANGFRAFKRKHFSNSEYVDFISQLPVRGMPDETVYYSNFAYHLLAVILEETYQMPFHEILKEKLTDPLGMKATYSQSSNQVSIPNLAVGYSFNEDESTWMANDFIDLTLGRRIFSTAHDLGLWIQEMSEGKVLTQESLVQMKANHLGDITDGLAYGYGWVTYRANEKYGMGDLDIEEPYIIHGGNTEGFRAMAININEGDYIISFLTNSGWRTNEMDLATNIVHNLID